VFSNRVLTKKKESKKHTKLVYDIDALVDRIIAKNEKPSPDIEIEKNYRLNKFLKRRTTKKPFRMVKNRFTVR
jgi:hypothetical protein